MYILEVFSQLSRVYNSTGLRVSISYQVLCCIHTCSNCWLITTWWISQIMCIMIYLHGYYPLQDVHLLHTAGRGQHNRGLQFVSLLLSWRKFTRQCNRHWCHNRLQWHGHCHHTGGSNGLSVPHFGNGHTWYMCGVHLPLRVHVSQKTQKDQWDIDTWIASV